ncbi:MAG TPA: DUF4230 domain-containing protein [Cytophagaceae bacterium]|jgi:hypothetical protein|nr:DUF4230 domain-containing protein [Cytophagaceae bacterium]
MNKFRTTLQVFSVFIVFTAAYLIYNQFTKLFSKNEAKTVVTNSMVVEKIESIGKLELCKYFIKDIIEHQEIKEWWPDPKIVLIVSGEVVGCLDLKKIDSNAIRILTDKITIKLPEPEICYVKINHQESKVYNIENEFFNKPKLIDKAYSLAEKSIRDSALQMKILDQTKSNAQIILKPMLENFTGKKVELLF